MTRCAGCGEPATVIAKVYSDDARKVLCGKCADGGCRFSPTGLVIDGKGRVKRRMA